MSDLAYWAQLKIAPLRSRLDLIPEFLVSTFTLFGVKIQMWMALVIGILVTWTVVLNRA